MDHYNSLWVMLQPLGCIQLPSTFLLAVVATHHTLFGMVMVHDPYTVVAKAVHNLHLVHTLSHLLSFLLMGDVGESPVTLVRTTPSWA